MYAIRPGPKLCLLLGAVGLAVARAAEAAAALAAGRENQLLAFPLAVIFPLALIVALSRLPATRTREGALMRLGTIIQLAAVIALPCLALYLALGLPVVFLVVEMFETRFPAGARERIAGMLVE